MYACPTILSPAYFVGHQQLEPDKSISTQGAFIPAGKLVRHDRD
jgi:hypothetical protein